MTLFFFALTFLMLAVIYYDTVSFTIPNWLWQAVLLLYVLLVGADPHWRASMSPAEYLLLGGLGVLSLLPFTTQLLTEEQMERVFEIISGLMLLVLAIGLYHAFEAPGYQWLSAWMPADYALFGAEQDGVVFSSFLCLLLLLLVGMVIFILGWTGGGDVKMLAALALWTGAESSLELVFGMGILGGLLIIPLLLLRDVVDPESVTELEWKGSRLAAVVMVPYYNAINYGRLLWRFVTLPLRQVVHRHVPQDKLPPILQDGQPMAYGIPIAIAFLILLFTDNIPYLPLASL